MKDRDEAQEQKMGHTQRHEAENYVMKIILINLQTHTHTLALTNTHTRTTCTLPQTRMHTRNDNHHNTMQ